MIRTPLYRRLASGEQAPIPREEARDDYVTKLVKYVPTEVIAVFVTLASVAATVNRSLLMTVFIVSFIATPLYFWTLASKLPAPDRPRWYFYVLSLIAFVVWSQGSSDDVRTLFGLSAQASEVILGLGALLIPLVDEALTILLAPRQ